MAHAQAIDNVYYGSQSEQDAFRAAYFGEAKVFTDKSEALAYAREEAEEYDVLEYGVSVIEFDRPLVPMTQDQIKAILGF